MVFALALAPAVAEACATCISSAYGDRTFNWAFLSLLLVPFVIAGGIGLVLFFSYRRSVAPARALPDEPTTTPHLLSKETT
jgi:quinol-cytochrome oxidoreductase complex cytochrome b subunit